MSNAEKVKAEYDNDPEDLYSLVVTVNDLKTALTAITRTKNSIVNMRVIAEEIVTPSEFENLSSQQKLDLEIWYGRLNEVDLNSVYLRNVLKRFFANGSTTMDRLKLRVGVNRLQELRLKLPTDHQLAQILGLE